MEEASEAWRDAVTVDSQRSFPLKHNVRAEVFYHSHNVKLLPPPPDALIVFPSFSIPPLVLEPSPSVTTAICISISGCDWPNWF